MRTGMSALRLAREFEGGFGHGGGVEDVGFGVPGVIGADAADTEAGGQGRGELPSFSAVFGFLEAGFADDDEMKRVASEPGAEHRIHCRAEIGPGFAFVFAHEDGFASEPIANASEDDRDGGERGTCRNLRPGCARIGAAKDPFFFGFGCDKGFAVENAEAAETFFQIAPIGATVIAGSKHSAALMAQGKDAFVGVLPIDRTKVKVGGLGLGPGPTAVGRDGAAAVNHEAEETASFGIEVERPTGLATAADIFVVDAGESVAVVGALP